MPTDNVAVICSTRIDILTLLFSKLPTKARVIYYNDVGYALPVNALVKSVHIVNT